MFDDDKPKKSSSESKYKKENLKTIERFVHESSPVSDYSYTENAFVSAFNLTTDYTYMDKQLKSTSERLKKAMFKTSSKGIALALQKK